MAKKVAKRNKSVHWGLIVFIFIATWILLDIVNDSMSGRLEFLSLIGQAMSLSFWSFVFLAYLEWKGVGGKKWKNRLRIGYRAAFALTCLLVVPLVVLSLS